jgi:hypothetical protein
MGEEFQNEWLYLIKRLEMQFGEGLEMEGIILLIGTNELGKGYLKFSKQEKMEVMHIGVCKILEPEGFYRFTGTDTDGWPHYEAVKPLPPQKPGEQMVRMKKAILGYFKNIAVL